MIRMRIFRMHMFMAVTVSMPVIVAVVMAVVMAVAVMMIVPFGLFLQSAQTCAEAVTELAILNIRAGR